MLSKFRCNSYRHELIVITFVECVFPAQEFQLRHSNAHPVLNHAMLKSDPISFFKPAFQTSLLGYSTLYVPPNSSLILLMLTNLVRIFMLPALSFVPLALAPPKGC